MKFLPILLLLAGAAQAQQPAAPAPLPIKTGEWKMTAIVHGKDNDLTHTFFTCIEQNDLSKLVPQGNLPKNLTCTQNDKQFTAQGMMLDVTCKSPGASVHTNYNLARNSDSLVTGVMNMDVELKGDHAKSATNIVFEWQKEECTKPDAQIPPAAGSQTTPAPTLGPNK